MKTYHLTPTENGWVLAEEGQTKPFDVCWTKWQALDRAKEAFERQKVILKIHRQDGTLEESRAYPRSRHQTPALPVPPDVEPGNS